VSNVRVNINAGTATVEWDKTGGYSSVHIQLLPVGMFLSQPAGQLLF